MKLSDFVQTSPSTLWGGNLTDGDPGIPVTFSLSLSQLSQLYIHKEKLFTDCKLASEEVGATVHLNLQVRLYSNLEVAHARDQGDSQDQVQARKPSRYSETQQTGVYRSSGLQLKYILLLHTLPQIMYFR
jgi:hypothetical protein